MENILDVKIKQRYDTEANWSSANPVLLEGEIAISSDKNGMFKVGNGSLTWSALSYNQATSAEKLATARTINGTSFNGAENITTANWGTSRNISITDSSSSNTGTAVSVNGGVNATLKLPATIKATIKGNADTAIKATQDSAGQQINTTYIKSITTNGKDLTYTKGNGTTATVDTQKNLITLTKSEYDALVTAGTVNENNYYFITDDANTSPTLIQYVTFAASGWTTNSSSGTYTQTVTASQITAADEPMIIKSKDINVGATEAKAYNKAFSILCDGAGETGNGTVTWVCYKKPVTNITVGLIKVLT